MHTFSKRHRDAAMTHTVSFHDVPMFRGLAFAINHIEEHGARVDIFSADRRDRIVAEHNHQFGTRLSGQQALIDAHRRDPANHAAANSPRTTSHCLYSDGSPVYRTSRGQHVSAGGRVPWYELGIDLADHGQAEDVREFLRVAHKLGYHFVQPYSAGSERHHVVCALSPVPTLEHWNVISKERGR